MNAFHLQIVTPDGLIYDGEALQLSVRAISGDLGILANHIDMVTALGMGQASVRLDENSVPRKAACIGGLLSVSNGSVKLVATTFEWAEDIDKQRAENAYQRAKSVLEDKNTSERDMKLAEAKLKRALVRKGVANSI